MTQPEQNDPNDWEDSTVCDTDGPSRQALILGRFANWVHVLIGVFLYANSIPYTFLRRWLGSRLWRDVLLGVPALLIGMALLALVAAGLRLSRYDLALEYRDASAEAAELGDMGEAGLWLEKAMWLDENDPSPKYALALNVEQGGNRERAREIIRRLAPDDAPGYTPAHFWLVEDLTTRHQLLTSQMQQTLEHHLTQALRSRHHAPQAKAMLAQVCLMRGDTEQAEAYLREASVTLPSALLPLARLYRQQGKRDFCLRIAEKAAAYYRDAAASDPDDWEMRQNWALSELLTEDFVQAERIVKEAGDCASNEQRQVALAAVYVEWLEAQCQNEPANFSRQLEVMELALNCGSRNPRIIDRLLNVAMLDVAEHEPVSEALRVALAFGTAPVTTHVILGVVALQRGDTDSATGHWSLARDRNPEVPFLMNYLARAFAGRDEPDPIRALQLVDAALELADDPEIHETRGTILVQLQRDQDAIVEYEEVLQALPQRTEIHAKLAEIYNRLGHSERAAHHRRLAE